MISAPQSVQIQRFAVGLYNFVVGSATLALINKQATDSDLNTALNGYFAGSFGALPTTTVAANLVANLGINAGSTSAAAVAEAQAYVTARLNAAAPDARAEAVSEIIDFFTSLTNDANYAAAATAFNAQMLRVNAYSGVPERSASEFVPTSTRDLTLGVDDFLGTLGNDLFVADGVGNKFTTDDRINGDAGLDTLMATMASQIAPTAPILNNVEKVVITARSGEPDSAVQFDLGRSVGITAIESLGSSADLRFDNVRLAPGRVTEDLAITLRDSEAGAVDFGLYFDTASLRSTSSAASVINLRVIDTYNTYLGNAPLKDSPYGAFIFSYSINGAPLQVATLASQAIQDAQTFPAMVLALQAAIDSIFPAGSVKVNLGSTYTVEDSVTGNNNKVQGTEIVISSTAGIVFDTSQPGSGWLSTQTLPAINMGLYTSFNTDVQASTALIASTITLDNVGSGGISRDLVVGAMPVSTDIDGGDKAGSGVERFNITIEDTSKLGMIASTGNSLREVVVKNGTPSEPSGGSGTAASPGALVVKDRPVDPNENLPAVVMDQFGLTDVRVVDGSAMTGSFDFTAGLTDTAIAKYLNRTDPANDAQAEYVQFAYSGGAAGDTIALTISNSLAGSTGLLSAPSQADTRFAIDGHAGNDVITVNLTDSSSLEGPDLAARAAQKSFDNIHIDGGEGNDTIRTPGVADMVIEAGAGNDTVLTDNSALSFAATPGSRTVWTVAAAGGSLGSLVGQYPAASGVPDQFMWNGKLTVTYASAIGAAGGVTNTTAAAGNNGWESTVTIPVSENFSLNQENLNAAIKLAINSDAVLSKLMVALNGPENTLRILSLVDGANNLATGLDIRTSFAAPSPSSADATAMLAAYKIFTGNSGATASQAITASIATSVQLNTRQGMASDAATSWEAQGTSSSNDRDNTIDMGAGDDLLVLSSTLGTVAGGGSSETVRVAGDDIGKDVIVNFMSGASATGANDRLDFNAQLIGLVTGSGGAGDTISRDIAISLGAEGVGIADSVHLVTGAFTAAQSFEGLTDAALLAAINTAGGLAYGGLLDATLNAVANGGAFVNVQGALGGTLVGSTYNVILMVENDANDGEYKVFKLTADTSTTGDFTSAALLGILDFGNTLTGLTAADNLVA